MKETETYLKRFFLLFLIQFIWTFSINGQCDRSKDSINLVKFHEALDGINWTYDETQLYPSFDPPNLPNAGQSWDTNTPIDLWHGIALDSNGCVTMIAIHNNNVSGELPDFLSEFTQLAGLNLADNHLTGPIPASLGELEHLTRFNLRNNDLEGCIPEELNVCLKGFSSSFENDGYDFTFNGKLPNQGSFSRLCTWGAQIGEPCDDGDPESARDLIQEDCSCRGIYCKITDSLELLKLYDATHGNQWSFDKSTYETKIGTQSIPNPRNKWSPNLPINKWHGVRIDFNGCVTDLYLSDNNLSSELPSLDLPFLKVLVVSNNELSGSLSNFDKTPWLSTLDCSFNQLQDSLPLELPPYLRYLDISNNQFEGVLFDIDKLSSLSNLYCNNNQLTGSIPSITTENRSLTHFDCSGNQFQGAIPLMNDAHNLEYFNCSNNQLTGDIPPFSKQFDLRYFNCSNNQLDANVLLYEGLDFSHFYCQNNNLKGPLPDFRRFGGATVFDCSNNNLSGKLPNFTFYKMVTFDCSNNQFEEGLPELIASFSLEKFDCSNNQFKGTLPELRGSFPLKEFDCSNNNLTGELGDFNGLVTLEKFDCSNNQLTGTIKDFENVPFLKSFKCANNKISGRLPSFDFLQDLEEFSCRSNLITRSIPSLDSLPNLRIFDCAENNISDTIPNFNNNPNLEEFYCESNLFLEGKIPDLTSVPNLIHFNCGTNQLTGEIPSLLKNKRLKSFIFSNNKIEGKLHYSIERLDSLERFYGFNNQLEGCIPFNFDKFCQLGSSLSTDSVGVNLSLNPMLPWHGDIEPFCDNEPQLDQPCDDGNPETENDIIQNDCSCEGSTPSGVKQIENSDFHIYPNPTTGIINLPEIDFQNISLYNSAGQKNSMPIKSKLDLSLFPNGIYYLKIQTNDNTFLKKVVKK